MFDRRHFARSDRSWPGVTLRWNFNPDKSKRLNMTDPGTKQTASLWRPLRSPTFRNLLVADIASDVGTFMQGVGAAWMMVSLNAGPLYVALTQTASALPFFVLALPAGAIGDIVDRRKLILFTETWMAAVAIVLAGVTLAGRLSPGLLLVLTFALSAGDAIESPTWRAVLPELVSKEDLAAAAALNGIEFNLARAIGPALAGVVIAVWNVGTAFVVNAASFLGVMVVIARWKRPVHKRITPPETLGGATVAALRYVRYSPAIRALIFRSGILMFFASGLLALLPSVAREVSHSLLGYGLLLGCFGLGAVLGAMVMQRVRARWSAEVVVSGGVLIFGLTTVATGSFHALTGLFLKLPDATVDVTPWIHWRLPTILGRDSAPTEAGPILVTIAYHVDAEKVPAFINAINRYGRIRRRDGAYQLGIFRDLENPDRYLETFLVDSWAEHLRQHERSTRADRLVTEQVEKHTRGEPIVRHLVYAAADAVEHVRDHSQ
jgi:MFS family permease